jgi:hypothetical protein
LVLRRIHAAVVTSVALLKIQKEVITQNFANHYVLLVLVDLILSAEFVLTGVLHVLEALPLKEDVQFILLQGHYVRALAED